MLGGAERLEALVVLFGTVAHVGVPAIPRMASRQPVHQPIANGLGEYGGGGDGLAARIAVDQGIMGVSDLGQRQAVDDDAVGVAGVGTGTESLAQGKAG